MASNTKNFPARSSPFSFGGEEETLVQMGKFQEETDRALRQETWELVTKRRLQETEKFDEFFEWAREVARADRKNSGFENSPGDYAFKARGRFDYTPEDRFTFHDAIEKEVMPLVRELQSVRRQQLKLPALRPWDLSA